MSLTTKKKYVEKEVAEDFSLPEENQEIAKVVKPMGNNLHEVESFSGESFLVSMPPKFRKHIWIKRGDFLIIEPIEEGNKVKAEIARILTKEHIQYYIEQKIWPDKFKEDVEEKAESSISNEQLMIENPNKIPATYETSDSSDESESDGSYELNEEGQNTR